MQLGPCISHKVFVSPAFNHIQAFPFRPTPNGLAVIPPLPFSQKIFSAEIERDSSFATFASSSKDNPVDIHFPIGSIVL
jgi:hypothetical protein